METAPQNRSQTRERFINTDLGAIDHSVSLGIQ